MSVLRRNVVWLLLSQGGTWIFSIITWIVVPPLLGEQLFGEISFVAAYAGIFELIAIFGTGSFLIKTVSRDPAARGHLLVNALSLKFVTALIASVMASGLGFALGFSQERMTLVFVFCAGIVLGSLNNVVLAALHGTQEIGRPAFWDVVQRFFGLVLGIGVLVAGGGVTAFAVTAVSVGVLPLIGNSWALRREMAAGGGLDPAVWRAITVGGAPFFALAGLNLLQGTIDVPMLEGLAGTDVVGWYTLALRWVTMPGLLATVAATAFFPALSAKGATVNEEFTRMANRCLHLVSLLAIPASVGIALIAGRFIALLYGGEFQQTVPLMRLLSLEVPLAAIDVVIGVVIIAADRQRQWVVVALVAAIFNPLANLVAIPLTADWYDNGAIGAAFTTVLTELIMFTGAMLLRPAGVFDRELRGVVGRIVLASAAMIPVVLLLRSVPLIVTVIAAAAVYAAASVALKTFDMEEIRQLGRQFKQRRRNEDRPEEREESGSPL